MKIAICDKCEERVNHGNRVHVYNYTVRTKKGRNVSKPKRLDFDLCNGCREHLLAWFMKDI